MTRTREPGDDDMDTRGTRYAARAFPAAELEDATILIARGRALAQDGVRYCVDGMVPNYGMLGFLTAYTKVGKTTLGQALAGAVAMGRDFLERPTSQTKVLVLAAEDPPEYTAWLTRHLDVDEGQLTFRCLPVVLNPIGLARICATVAEGGYGLVLIASWQAVVRGLIRDENDNAGAVRVVEDVKAAARHSRVPWLIDAHAGKSEDQRDDADPTRAMRGASAAAGSADYTLSLRYADGSFGTRRRLSGKGRFVNFPPLLLDFDPATSHYTALGSAKSATAETTWRLICELGALTTDWRTTAQIAIAAGLPVTAKGYATSTARRHISDALHDRLGVETQTTRRKGSPVTNVYRRATDELVTDVRHDA